MRADRLLQEITLLRQHERLSAPEMARRLEVTTRTVMRDMEALSAAGVPVYATPGRDGGFSLLPGYRPRTEGLTPEESEALFVAGAPAVAKALGMDAPFSRALRKLADTLPDAEARAVGAARRRIVVDAAGWLGMTSEELPLSRLFEAVQDERRVRMQYVPRDTTRGGERTVDPWGLVLAGDDWYLIAARDRQPRSYRVSRMHDVEVLAEPAVVPADLDLLGVWQEMQKAFASHPGTPIRLRVRRERWDLTRRMLALSLRPGPVVRPDGGDVIVDAEVLALRGAAGGLLGLGTWVEVLEPPELRDMMREIAAEVVGMYGRPTSG